MLFQRSFDSYYIGYEYIKNGLGRAYLEWSYPEAFLYEVNAVDCIWHQDFTIKTRTLNFKQGYIG